MGSVPVFRAFFLAIDASFAGMVLPRRMAADVLWIGAPVPLLGSLLKYRASSAGALAEAVAGLSWSIPT
jgi:hypothetical protein